MTDTSKTPKIIKMILFSTLTVWRCDGEWYHFYDFCCFRCDSHCILP